MSTEYYRRNSRQDLASNKPDVGDHGAWLQSLPYCVPWLRAGQLSSPSSALPHGPLLKLLSVFSTKRSLPGSPLPPDLQFTLRAVPHWGRSSVLELKRWQWTWVWSSLCWAAASSHIKWENGAVWLWQLLGAHAISFYLYRTLLRHIKEYEFVGEIM